MSVRAVPVSDLALVTILVVSAVTDLRVGRIFNSLTYPAIALGLAAAAVGMGPTFPSAIAGCLAGGAVLYSMFALGWMGGGDVKLMATVGAFKGFPFVLDAMFYSILLGGVYAALALIWRGQAREVVGDLAVVWRRVNGAPGLALDAIPPRGGNFPFGVAICLGTMAALILEWPR